MPIKAEYQTETYLKKLAEVRSQSVVECRFTAGDGAGELLAVCPQVFPSLCEATSGRINYGGRLVCTAVCASEGGKLVRVQKGAEFTHFCEDERFAPANTPFCKLSCDRVTVRREGSAFVVSVVVGAHVLVWGAAERTLLASAEGAVCNMSGKKLYTDVTFSGDCEAEDDFEVAGVEDILAHDASCVVTDCRCASGEVELSGEICLSLLALRGGEPVTLERTIPFTSELMCDEAIMSCRAVCDCSLAETSLNATVNEERGRCAVNLSAKVKFFGYFSSPHEVVCADDAFRKEGEAVIDLHTESVPVCEDIKVWSERVSGACSVNVKLDYDCALRATVSPSAECSWSPDTCTLEGAVNCTLLYMRGGAVHSASLSLPFSVKLSGGQNAVITGVAVSGISVRQRAEGECEAEAVLRISAAVCPTQSCSYISRIEEGEDSAQPPCAISVLLAKKGQTLWQAAKELRLTPEELKAECEGVNFPLSGEERLVIYRRK